MKGNGLQKAVVLLIGFVLIGAGPEARADVAPPVEIRMPRATPQAFSGQVEKMPTGSTQMLVSVDYAIGPSYEVVIAGDPGSADTKEIISTIHATYLPNKVLIFKRINGEDPEITSIAGFTKYHETIDGKATVYVCQNHNCQLPTTDIKKMLELLKYNSG